MQVTSLVTQNVTHIAPVLTHKYKQTLTVLKMDLLFTCKIDGLVRSVLQRSLPLRIIPEMKKRQVILIS